MRLYCSVLLLVLFSKCFAQPDEAKRVTLSPQEKELAGKVNNYRKSIGLEAVPVSVSLSYVAQVHAKDLMDHHDPDDRCNMHSWSFHGPWTACCYTPDHAKAACMWNKPRELTQYKGNGFEIVFFSTRNYDSPADQATDALINWKKSPGHRTVIANSGPWARMKWNAMGVGVNRQYVSVWFGTETDPAGFLSY